MVTALSRRAQPITWKAKFGGQEVSGAKRLRMLEEENARLKRLLADTMLDNEGLKDLLSKKSNGRVYPPLLQPRCATTTVGLWLRLDERRGHVIVCKAK